MSRFHAPVLALLTAATASIALSASVAAAQDAANWRVSPAGASASSLGLSGRDWSSYAARASLVSASTDTADVAPAGDAGSTRFAFQALVDAAYPFSGRLTGEVQHRYVGAADPRFDAVAAQFGGDYQPSAVTIGVRYSFGR